MSRRREQEAPKFNPGDLVQHITGGPKLAILGEDQFPPPAFLEPCSGRRWKCQWFRGTKLFAESFPEHVLKLYQPDEKK